MEKTKTECGCRFIPMTEEVYRSLKNILAHRKQLKTEMIVDSYSGFILLDKDDKPKVALHIENEMRWAMKKYKKLYPDKPLPHITPMCFAILSARIWQVPVWILKICSILWDTLM